MNAGKGEDPRRQRGADIRAEDDIQRLAKFHDPGIDQTHQHNRDRRGRLHRYGNGRAQQQAHPGARCHCFQQLLQLTARHLFQVTGHHIHTEQEKGQAQYQPQKRKNIHVFFSFGHPPAHYFIFAYCFIVTHLGESCPVNLPQRMHFPHICAVA